jgi:hypothetical protein
MYHAMRLTSNNPYGTLQYLFFAFARSLIGRSTYSPEFFLQEFSGGNSWRSHDPVDSVRIALGAFFFSREFRGKFVALTPQTLGTFKFRHRTKSIKLCMNLYTNLMNDLYYRPSHPSRPSLFSQEFQGHLQGQMSHILDSRPALLPTLTRTNAGGGAGSDTPQSYPSTSNLGFQVSQIFIAQFKATGP